MNLSYEEHSAAYSLDLCDKFDLCRISRIDSTFHTCKST
jgi:hypothetical protein